MLAYRVWGLVLNDLGELRLGSIGRPGIWEVEAEAYCDLRSGLVADHLRDKRLWRHECGLYAFKTISWAMDICWGWGYEYIPGAVQVFGTVLETEFGYRVTNAYIEALFEYPWPCDFCRGEAKAIYMAPFPSFHPVRFVCPRCLATGHPTQLEAGILTPQWQGVDRRIVFPRPGEEIVAKGEVYNQLGKYYRVPVVSYEVLRKAGWD